MDMSKLPRLSQTKPPEGSDPAATDSATATQPPPQQQQQPVYYAAAYDRGAGVGADVWLAAIVGIIFVLLGLNFARYLVATLTGQTFHTNVTWQTGEKAGQEVAYFDLQGGTAYTEAGLFLFGAAMLLEAAALLAAASPRGPRRLFVTIALALAALATAFNLFVVVKLFGMGIMPIVSLLAVAFGGYMAAQQWWMLQSMPRGSSGREIGA